MPKTCSGQQNKLLLSTVPIPVYVGKPTKYSHFQETAVLLRGVRKLF